MRILRNLLAVIGLVTSLVSMGEVKVDFEQNSLPQLNGLLGVMGAYQITANINVDNIDAKFYEIIMIVSHKGMENKELIGYTSISSDTTSICVTVMPIDSVTAMIYVNPSSSLRRKVSIPTDNMVLIDLDNKKGYKAGEPFPLVAYSTGIVYKQEINGKTYTGFDICGLRFSEVHPSEWYTRFNLEDYMYLEANPVKEINYDKKLN